MSKRLQVIALSLFLLTTGTLAMSQLPTATILGVVKDSTGAVIPGVAITAKHLETGLTRNGTSTEDGSYRFSALPVGAYEVRAEQPGFRTEVRSGLTLTVSQEAVVNFALEPGAIDQTVVVTEDAPLVNTTSGSLGGLVDEHKVAELPLNGRNFIDLTLLQPGITQHRNLAVAASTVGLWFSSNGAPLRSNNYLLDGAIMTNLTNGTSASQDGSTLGVEGIREYRVITNSFSAEYGMTMGSQVMVVTKGGTNSVHGSLFEYFRNSALDARNFFDYKTPASNRRLPAFTRNQFGASVGGPIKKDKTFFFGVYEGLRQRLGVTTISNTIGAGCHGPAGAVITSTACPQLVNVPSVTISPVTAPLLDLFPLPNLPGDKFTFPFTQPTRDDYGQGRVDQIFSSADSVFGRYTISDTTETNPLNYPLFHLFRYSKNQFSTLSHNHIFSPALLSTARFSMSRTHPGNGSPSGLYGPRYSLVPGKDIGTLNIGGVTGMGPNNSSPADFLQNVFTWSGDFFYTRGRHSLKLGTLINHYRQDLLIGVNESGTVTFANVNSFLLGQPSQYSALTPGSLQTRNYHWNTLGFYAQDDFRVLPNLTFNLGLRYEFFTAPNEVGGHGSNLRDIQRDDKATLGSVVRNMSLLNLSPRFGFAWDVTGDGKTAIRGGFAELYDVGVFGVSMVIAASGTPPFSSFSACITSDPRCPRNLTLPLVFPEVGKTLRLLDYQMQQPHILDYNLTLERQLPWQIGVTLGYAGSRGINLMQVKDGNPTIPQILDGRKFWTGNDPRVNPNWGAIELHTAGGNSWYNAMQFGLNKRLTSGLQFQSSYTWSKVIDETQGQAGADTTVSSIFGVDPSDRHKDRGPADFDLTHNWQFNAIYQVPTPFKGAIPAAVLGGWRASGIMSVQSGYPFTPSLRTNRSRSGVNAGGSGQGAGNIDHPDLVPGRTKKDIIRGGPSRYFDPTAFTLQDAGFLGTSGRNYLTGPGYFNLDFSLGKNIPIKQLGESGALEFRGEFFNILNHANFAMNDTFRQVFAGNATGEAPLPTAGVITTTGSARSRQIQLALKLLF